MNDHCGLARCGSQIALADMSFTLPADPLFASQFHLFNTAPGQLDLRLFDPVTGAAVWNDYTGAGVQVAIIDGGIDAAHVDLDANYVPDPDGLDGADLSPDPHGTSVAGIVAAERNGTGTVGIAYDVQFTVMAAINPDNFDGDPATVPPVSIADSIAAGIRFDIVNNSWGDGNLWFDQATNPDMLYGDYGAIHAARDALIDGGRGGLGTIFVKSGGNERGSDGNAGFMGLNVAEGTVTVGAVDRDGFVSSYSSPGASLLVSAFGTPGEVVTTDITGAGGYSADDYTSDFSGTSSAAPMVSGIVALMLQANPGLGYRDVADILALTARHVGSDVGAGPAGFESTAWYRNASTHWNGGGLHFSEDYGFGLVDALAAVRLAETWTEQDTRANLGELTGVRTGNTAPTLPIPDDNPAGVTASFTVTGGMRVEHVEIGMRLTHDWVADLTIKLVAPSGTESILLSGNGGSFAAAPAYGITLSSNAFRGEDAAGVWQLVVIDSVAADAGTIADLVLTVRGSTDADDTYVLTDEAAQYMAADTVIGDDNGGIDTINAAAVSSDVLIRLFATDVSTVRGVGFYVTDGIENAVGGDGNDVLVGNAGNNVLRGGRGNDYLEGAAGTNTLDGGAGSDLMYGSTGSDLYRVDSGGDQIFEADGDPEGVVDTVESRISYTLGTDLENLVLLGAATSGTGNADHNTIVGNGANNQLSGGDGNDVLDGGAGADTLNGGLGDDTLHVDSASDSLVGSLGIDTAIATVSYALSSAVVERLELAGTAAIDASGSNSAETLVGNAGANMLDGQGGADTLIGGAGGDTYVVDNFGDVVSETSTVAGEIDTVRAVGTYTLGANLENLVITGIDTLRVGTGNALSNAITGSLASNTLRGLAGQDTLDGGAGHDTLEGGDGADHLIGGADVDRLDGGAGGDRLQGGLAQDSLTGGAGADTMEGGAGNDTYGVDDVFDRAVETGTSAAEVDLVRSSVNFTLGAFVEQLELTGTLGLNGAGNAQANTLKGNVAANRLSGLDGNDSLIGVDGNDTLLGGNGDDTLVGATGSDSMVGGAGNDAYNVQDASDVVTESSAGGTADAVFSSVSYTLSAYVERLTLQGTSAISGTGNAQSNVITGNGAANALKGSSGNDTLAGGAGNDTLAGGAGNDSLAGSTGLDVFLFDAVLGTTTNVDRISGFVTADDTIRLENAFFTRLTATGALASSAFVLGTTAVDAGDRIVYDRVTGQLWYDSDGSGAAAKILFATLTAGTVVNATDFVIV